MGSEAVRLESFTVGPQFCVHRRLVSATRKCPQCEEENESKKPEPPADDLEPTTEASTAEVVSSTAEVAAAVGGDQQGKDPAKFEDSDEDSWPATRKQPVRKAGCFSFLRGRASTKR